MKNKIFDIFGMGLSGLCIIHCIVLPFIVLIFPAANFVEDHLVHDLIFVFIILTALLSFLPHAIKNKSLTSLFLPFLGVIFLVISNSFFHHEKSAISLGISFLGSFCLILAHYKHYQARNCCKETA